MKTYTEYRIEFLCYNDWHQVERCTLKSINGAKRAIEKRNGEMIRAYNHRPDTYPLPEKWRIVSRQVTITEWKPV